MRYARAMNDVALRRLIDRLHAQQAAALFWYTFSTLPGPHVLAYVLASRSGGLALYAWANARVAREFSRIPAEKVVRLEIQR